MHDLDDFQPFSPEAEEAERPRRLGPRALACGLAGILLPIVGLLPALAAILYAWQALRATRTETDAQPTLFDMFVPAEDRLGAYFSHPRGKALVGLALGLGGVGIQGAVAYLAVRYWN